MLSDVPIFPKNSHEFVPFQAVLEGLLWTLQLHIALGRPSIGKKNSGCLVYTMIMTSLAFGLMNISPSCPFRGVTKVSGPFLGFSGGVNRR